MTKNNEQVSSHEPCTVLNNTFKTTKEIFTSQNKYKFGISILHLQAKGRD